jgi:uncharacterized small protein (DUF1192 family)
VLTNFPHDTQEACISALQDEIARVRAIVNRNKVDRVTAEPEQRADAPHG